MSSDEKARAILQRIIRNDAKSDQWEAEFVEGLANDIEAQIQFAQIFELLTDRPPAIRVLPPATVDTIVALAEIGARSLLRQLIERRLEGTGT